MLITNILLGIIIFFMVVIYGGICNIFTKLNGINIGNAEYLRLKKLSDSLKPTIRRVKDEKKT